MASMYGRLLSILLFAGATSSSMLASSCKCQTVLPVVNRAQGLVEEAHEALVQAQRALDGVRLPPASMQDVNQAFDRAWAGLRESSKLLAACADVCEAPDLPSVFKAFNDAWSVVRAFLVLAQAPGAAPGTPLPVQDPAVYGMRR